MIKDAKRTVSRDGLLCHLRRVWPMALVHLPVPGRMLLMKDFPFVRV